MSQPIITFTGDGLGDMVVSHPDWDHGLKISKGVVLIDASKHLISAELHGWQGMPRATKKLESDLGLIRVMKI